MTTLTLFKEDYLENHFGKCFIAINKGIGSISDEEILQNENQLPKLIERIIQDNRFVPPTISFEKEKVKVLPIQKDKAAFIKYSFPVDGSFQLLKYCPFSSDDRGWAISVQIDSNVLSFELDAAYATIDFSPEKKKEIAARILAASQWITMNLTGTKNAVEEYNTSLYGFILPRLEARLNTAKKKEQNKIDLNPF